MYLLARRGRQDQTEYSSIITQKLRRLCTKLGVLRRRMSLTMVLPMLNLLLNKMMKRRGKLNAGKGRRERDWEEEGNASTSMREMSSLSPASSAMRRRASSCCPLKHPNYPPVLEKQSFIVKLRLRLSRSRLLTLSETEEKQLIHHKQCGWRRSGVDRSKRRRKGEKKDQR